MPDETSFVMQQIEDAMPDSFTIHFTRDKNDGGWVASIPEMPGCFSQGEDIQDAFEMIMDACMGWLESFDNLQ